ncbi:outer membrane beta-barrel protein [Aquamicrobium sp. LC103]|uniref:outer membrane protein n=1 Tax=Aquamicrobium sp. LC103 TaxID=1120658 RepID=UPI00063E91BB|nr:outer membrane beta-barrel protein [Aquamicrobium sp. LC103]TKT75352.1 porin family protein [Aquamicrobium sp. LC103]
MNLRSSMLLSAAAAAFMPAVQAGAADYDPPIVLQEAPEYVPVEIGSGWYLRGDVSYNVNDPVYDFELFGEDTDNLRIGGGIGAGYHFTDYLRGDLTLGFIGRDKYRYDDGIDAISASSSFWNGMANAYLDLGTYAGVTPYVGGGVGVMYGRGKLSIDSQSLGIEESFSDDQYRFAYALNAGVAYKVTENASIDLGYQYLSSPDLEYIDSDSLDVRKGVDFHQIRVGLRYDLW